MTAIDPLLYSSLIWMDWTKWTEWIKYGMRDLPEIVLASGYKPPFELLHALHVSLGGSFALEVLPMS